MIVCGSHDDGSGGRQSRAEGSNDGFLAGMSSTGCAPTMQQQKLWVNMKFKWEIRIMKLVKNGQETFIFMIILVCIVLMKN